MTTVLNDLQHSRQLRLSYGTKTAHLPLLGIVWQYGEFWEAPDSPDQDGALVEMALYTIDFCTANGWNVSEVWDSVESDGVDLLLDRVLGRLARAFVSKDLPSLKKWTAYLLHELSLMCGSTKRFEQLLSEGRGAEENVARAI